MSSFLQPARDFASKKHRKTPEVLIEVNRKQFLTQIITKVGKNRQKFGHLEPGSDGTFQQNYESFSLLATISR